MKIMNFTISNQAHAEVEEIKAKQGFQNNSEAMEWLIHYAYKHWKEEASQ